MNDVTRGARRGLRRRDTLVRVCGRGRGTRRRSATGSASSVSRSFSRWLPAGIAGRTGRSRSNSRFFPGYCFARFDVREAKPVLGCAGVVAIVGTPGVPSAISENEIDAVRRLLDTGLSCDPCPFIKEGMPVVVTHGPLKGVSGRLVCKGPHAWLVISIELIGRAVSVNIHAADVHAA